MSRVTRDPRSIRDDRPVRPLSGRLSEPTPERAAMPPVIITNARNARIRQAEEQLQREAEEERRRILEDPGAP